MAELNKIVPDSPKKYTRVLIFYYSFSGQTGVMINRLAAGIRSQGVMVFFEKLRPVRHLRFPVGGILRTYYLMLITFFRKRVPIRDISSKCDQEYDLIVVAGPTWSYNPSGPVLSFLDRYGKEVLADREVLPVISCRGYWRRHWSVLRKKLREAGAHRRDLRCRCPRVG
jgi:hypothetical protein